MTDIDVPDWVVEGALTAYVNAWDVSVTTKERCETEWDDQEIEHARVGVKAALRAALSAWLGPALNTYEVLQEGMGGCTDGNCVIKRPVGMHTNGGCRCSFDRIKAARMMRAGQLLFDTLRQEKPE